MYISPKSPMHSFVVLISNNEKKNDSDESDETVL